MLTKEIFTQKLSEKIRQAREDSGLSQEEVAHQTKLYRTYIGHLENGKYTPSVYTLYKIAKILKVKIQNLFPF